MEEEVLGERRVEAARRGWITAEENEGKHGETGQGGTEEAGRNEEELGMGAARGTGHITEKEEHESRMDGDRKTFLAAQTQTETVRDMSPGVGEGVCAPAPGTAVLLWGGSPGNAVLLGRELRCCWGESCGAAEGGSPGSAALLSECAAAGEEASVVLWGGSLRECGPAREAVSVLLRGGIPGSAVLLGQQLQCCRGRQPWECVAAE
ncbi:hypothetical protein NDU88_001132 [Pleurodeles waltl]|uniref:Uncharacterized protein n=1 Tax=Pleurodeles waltl TaxID=8319 RepID=A0AAV7KSM8_PLEWA|nr:hypothetical protein NDU88_001132 [Pleurodeles waltl]